MKRERTLQVVLALVGLFYVALIYPLYSDLRHSKWLLELKNETELMFLSFYVALGAFLLLRVNEPSASPISAVLGAMRNIRMLGGVLGLSPLVSNPFFRTPKRRL